MDETLLQPLNKLEASLNALVQSLVTTNTFSAAPKAAKDLVAADDELTSALVILKRHQDNYAEIVRLRAEAEALNQSIKETIRTCVTLRTELGEIHPSVLEESDDDDDDDDAVDKYNTVDYNTLLAFAFRIGKHNAIARKDAEREAERADVDARKQREQKDLNEPGDKEPGQTISNGPHAEAPVTATATTQEQTSTAQNDLEPGTTITTSQGDLRTQQVQTVLRQMRHLQRISHMEQSAPYPDANLLRIGELGRIHYIRELEGEQAADRTVEDMVKKVELQHLEQEASRREESSEQGRNEQQPAPRVQQQQQRPPERKPKKAFDVDFPGGDDDDDEDDDDD